LKTGLLLLNKPTDMRSTKCVELVRNKLGRKTKVGHGGTLDSTASGLLIILVGAILSWICKSHTKLSHVWALKL